jgi:hypothetical protein
MDSRVLIENISIGFLLSAICILGIIGNIVTFVVLCYQHRKKRRLILNYFLLALSIFDTLFLLFWSTVAFRYAHRLFGDEIPPRTFSTESGAYFGLIVKPSGYVGEISRYWTMLQLCTKDFHV